MTPTTEGKVEPWLLELVREHYDQVGDEASQQSDTPLYHWHRPPAFTQRMPPATYNPPRPFLFDVPALLDEPPLSKTAPRRAFFVLSIDRHSVRNQTRPSKPFPGVVLQICDGHSVLRALLKDDEIASYDALVAAHHRLRSRGEKRKVDTFSVQCGSLTFGTIPGVEGVRPQWHLVIKEVTMVRESAFGSKKAKNRMLRLQESGVSTQRPYLELWNEFSLPLFRVREPLMPSVLEPVSPKKDDKGSWSHGQGKASLVLFTQDETATQEPDSLVQQEQQDSVWQRKTDQEQDASTPLDAFGGKNAKDARHEAGSKGSSICCSYFARLRKAQRRRLAFYAVFDEKAQGNAPEPKSSPLLDQTTLRLSHANDSWYEDKGRHELISQESQHCRKRKRVSWASALESFRSPSCSSLSAGLLPNST